MNLLPDVLAIRYAREVSIQEHHPQFLRVAKNHTVFLFVINAFVPSSLCFRQMAACFGHPWLIEWPTARKGRLLNLLSLCYRPSDNQKLCQRPSERTVMVRPTAAKLQPRE